MTLGELNGKTRKVKLPDGEITEVYKVDYNIAHAVDGVVQCFNSVWIKARSLERLS